MRRIPSTGVFNTERPRSKAIDHDTQQMTRFLVLKAPKARGMPGVTEITSKRAMLFAVFINSGNKLREIEFRGKNQ